MSGACFVKYHLQHSLHAEHRGRTPKCPIANHRVEFGPFARLISSVRIAVDRSSSLGECPLELEVIQELDVDASVRGEDKIVRLGTVRLNLSEYVEESEALVRELGPAVASSPGGNACSNGGRGTSGPAGTNAGTSVVLPPNARKRTNSLSITGGSSSSSSSNTPKPTTNSRPATAISATNSTGTTGPSSATVDAASSSGKHAASASGNDTGVQDGIVRRYLLQDSKINSTIRVSILMVQVDGDRNYVAPQLRTAPVFGGIAGWFTGDQSEQPDEAGREYLGPRSSPRSYRPTRH